MRAGRVAVLWLILWMAPCKFCNTNAAVSFWTCPNLHGPEAIICTCELAHALQCRGTYTPDSFQNMVDVLRNLPSNNTVQILELKLKNFTEIPRDSFRDTNLHAMIISSADSLRLSPDSFRGLELSLVALGLPSNNLVSVPTEALQTLVFLEKMDFSDNRITGLSPEDLAPFANLEELNLSNNNISEIDEYSFKNNRKLKKLILDGNDLRDSLFSWSKTIYNGLPVLENLSLVRTEQSENLMKQTLPRLPGLIRLNLSFNNLTSVHFRAFVDLPKLQVLDISYNQLAFIDREAFQGLNNLVRLDLSHNRLTRVSRDAFIGLNSLVYLTINDNYLTELGEFMFTELKAIRFINARDNEIAFINAMALSDASFLESLELEDNNLQCTCKMKGFAMWLKTKSSLMSTIKKRQIHCETPLGTSRVLMDMKPYEFACSNETPAEPLAKIKEEERGHYSSVSSIRLQLIDYKYNVNEPTLILVWAIEDDAQPYECDAIFVFQRINQRDELRQKVKIVCDSDAEVNPRQLTIRLNTVTLDREKVYRFCIVLFSGKTLVPGCSELLEISGEQLTSASANPKYVSKTGSESEIEIGMPSIHVNHSASSPESMSVWWRFPSDFGVSDLCVLNVSLISGESGVAADKLIKCSKRTLNFTNVNPSESYRVCISVLEPADFYRENNCISLGLNKLKITPVTHNPIVTTVLTSVFVSLASILLIAIVLTARRMFWPSQKSISLMNSSPQYRVLYHQPEDTGQRVNLAQNNDVTTQEV